MLMHGVVGACDDAVLCPGDADAGGGGTGSAGADKELSVGLEGEVEGRSGYAGADEESVEGCAVCRG